MAALLDYLLVYCLFACIWPRDVINDEHCRQVCLGIYYEVRGTVSQAANSAEGPAPANDRVTTNTVIRGNGKHHI